MKPFNLEQAKAGKPVQTRDGRKARIICFDMKGGEFPIVALVQTGGEEGVFHYTLEGNYYRTSTTQSDLVMVPVKKTGWINIYPFNCGEFIYNTKERAVQNANCNVVDTIKIEWEE